MVSFTTPDSVTWSRHPMVPPPPPIDDLSAKILPLQEMCRVLLAED